MRELLLDKDGKLSSKRVMGYVFAFYAMIMYTLGSVGVVENDTTVLMAFIGAGVTGVGLGLLERRK